MNRFTIVRFIVGELEENAYIFSDKINHNSYIIDPGDSAETFETYILSNRLNPFCILLTHGHIDHWGAAWELSEAFHIPVYLSQKDEYLIRRNAKTISNRSEELFTLSPHTKDISALQKCNLPIPLDVISTPGHTPGSVTYVLGKAIFSGDTVFANGDIGEWRHSGGNKDVLFSSLLRLLQLPLEYMLYPGHGEIQLWEECAKSLKTRYTTVR